MAEEKILEQILSIVQDLKQGQKELNDKVNNIQLDFCKLDREVAENHKEIKTAIAEVKDEVKEIRKDLTNVEIITSSNWNDIAKLKAVK